MKTKRVRQSIVPHDCKCGADAEVLASEGMAGEAGFEVLADCGNAVWSPGPKENVIQSWNSIHRFHDCPRDKSRAEAK